MVRLSMRFRNALCLITEKLMKELFYLLWCRVLDCIFACFLGSSSCEEIEQKWRSGARSILNFCLHRSAPPLTVSRMAGGTFPVAHFFGNIPLGG